MYSECKLYEVQQNANRYLLQNINKIMTSKPLGHCVN